MSSTELVQRLDVNALIARAVDGNVAVETLERLFALATQVRAEQVKAAWHQAMAQFQADVPEIKKTKIANAGNYKYAYAPLEEVLGTVRPALARHGLSATFEILMDAAQVIARCIVSHEDGHSQVTEFAIPIDQGSRMNPAQQVASASTYARRYAYLAALGLAPEDDDDGAAAGEVRERTAQEMGGVSPRPRPHDDDYTKNMEPVKEYQDEDGHAVWRGTLVESRSYKGPTWTAYYFKGQDGKEFCTFDTKVCAELMKAVRVPSVEIIWEAKIKNGKEVGKDIISWKAV